MLKKETILKLVKPLIGLTLGGVGGLLLLVNSGYSAIGTNPTAQIFGVCTGLLMCMIAPIFIIPAPHDE